jgi:hypothetical protein
MPMGGACAKAFCILTPAIVSEILPRHATDPLPAPGRQRADSQR